MALRLRVVSIHAQLLGEDGSRTFGVHGGSIGRAADNDWILPDPDRYVSGHHARIEYRNGRFWLMDTSSNGTYLNDSTAPLGDNGPHALKDGDRLRLGDYELAVDLDTVSEAEPKVEKSRAVDNDLGAALDLGSLLANEDSASRARPVNAYGQSIELPPISGPDVALEPRSRLPARERDAGPAKESVPWNLSTRRRAEPYRNPAKVAAPEFPAAPAADGAGPNGSGSNGDATNGLHALCRGAGIDPASIPAALQQQVVQIAGQILRELSMGLMEFMQERNEFKRRFRISQDTIQQSDNNPLKFSAGVEEGLRKLFEQYGNRYLGPVDAVRESFREIRQHQQAMAGAMHAAFVDFVHRLDPADLRERFDRGLKRGGLLGAANKTKYWDLYAELYQTLAQMPKEDLPHVFIETFARSYEEKVQELSARKARGGAEKRPERAPATSNQGN
jgi:type VI secretion system protein